MAHFSIEAYGLSNNAVCLNHMTVALPSNLYEVNVCPTNYYTHPPIYDTRTLYFVVQVAKEKLMIKSNQVKICDEILWCIDIAC